MKKSSIISAILYGLCAIIWGSDVVIETIDGKYSVTPVLFALKVICMLCFAGAAIATIIRGCSGKND